MRLHLRDTGEAISASWPFPGEDTWAGLGSSALSVGPCLLERQEGIYVLRSGSESTIVLHINVFQMKGFLIFNVYICLGGSQLCET